MDQMNVQRWASSLRQSHRNQFQPLIATDISISGQHSVRDISTALKARGNKTSNQNQHYSFTLDFIPPKKNFNRSLKAQFYELDMAAKGDEKLRSSSNGQLSDNNTLNFHTRSAEFHDIDVLSDAGTYIIDDDIDVIQTDISKQKINPPPSTLRRYVNQTNNRHGTFDIHGLISPNPHTVIRPIVDMNIPTRDLSSSSSNSSSSSSSIHSFPDELEHTFHNDSTVQFQNNVSNNFNYERNTLLQQQLKTPPKNQIKPVECFVLPPTYETKLYPTTNISQQKTDASWKSQSAVKPISNKDLNYENSMSKSTSPPLSARSNPSFTEQLSFHLQKQHSVAKPSTRPQTAKNEHTSSFQPNSVTNKAIPTNAGYQRLGSASTATNNNDETGSNFTKIPTNKSFILRQQRSNLLASAPKPAQQQQTITKVSTRQPLKQTVSTSSTSSSMTNSIGQTNRAVELRRARAQEKIEQLSERTRKHLHKNDNNNHNNLKSDIMSASWHSSASSLSKTNSASLASNSRVTSRTNNVPRRQDMLTTRTLQSASYHRSSSVSPNLSEEKPARYPKGSIGSIRDIQPSQRMAISTYSIGSERCDSLRENGQRLAIRLIQLSSGILEKLKLNDTTLDNNVNVRDLEQLVDKLQTVNQTLIAIDASLTSPISDDAFI
ncbi:unnamed protein product [Adineta steineri]|uniref:Uncharacterized protein n=1 Tax=Adineta steineri TaxID=433720 RepID=A0A819T8Y1_9BILA|nr:unnamed protein product [Adineta steineri]